MNTVIYHKSDFDGIFCREIARKHFGASATYIGWEYGEPEPAVAPESNLMMLDISVTGLMTHPKLVWIDHHKSAMERFHHGIPGYRIDGVAACRLAWQWFLHTGEVNFDYGIARATDCIEPHNNNAKLPVKQDFVDRTVSEPLAVRLAGEYDIWDKRDPNAELFQHGLRSQDLDPLWEILLSGPTAPENGKQGLSEILVDALLEDGRALQYAKSHENESIIKSSGFTLEFEGFKFLACNAARYNSFLFVAGVKPEHEALLGFNFDGKKWRVSLYHAPGKEHHDLSLVAIKYLGGGHRGACGFTCAELPFKLHS